jgi:HEAT repeat protein
VRRAGWAAARALLERPGVDPDDVRERLVDPLVGVVLDPGGGTALRIRAATALGELRDRRAAEGLVLGLEAREPELREACHQALITVTRHDPTRSGESWSSWYSNHGERSRVEWLIEALLDDDPAFREAAAHELKERTKVFFGYYADLPRVERERAYERYRTWYREEGRIRFGA